MNIIDLHCDALLKLSEGKGKLRFADAPELQTNKTRLQLGQVKVQCFAIFLEPVSRRSEILIRAKQIDYFYKEYWEKTLI